jgi:uncharacterized protein involved in exopolysaccharide biosynthesis
MDDEIDLRDIFQALWKSRFLIGGIFMAAVVVAAAISFVMPQIYEVSSIVGLGNFGDPVYTSQASAKEIMLSEGFLLEVVEQLNLNMSSSEFNAFKNSVKVEPVEGSDNLLVISVETKKKQEGKEVVGKIISLFANRSQESYNRQKKILSDQLASDQRRLDALNNDTNRTREILMNIEKTQGSSPEESELRFSRTLEYLNEEEARRSTLIDHSLEIQRQLSLLEHLEVVQEPKEPVVPIGPRKALIIAIAGILGLMLGIFAAFLKEGLKRPSE